MVKRIIGMSVLVLWLALLCSETFPEFKARLFSVNGWDAAKQMLTGYLEQTQNPEEMRELQKTWMEVAPGECREYFTAAQAKNPQSPLYSYLLIRLEDDEKVQTQQAGELCRKSPDFYWGYRLLLLNLTSELLANEGTACFPQADNEDYLKLIEAGYQRFPEDGYFNVFLFHRYRIKGDFEQADGYLDKLKDAAILLGNWRHIQYFLVKSLDAKRYQAVVPALLSLAIQAQDIAAADSLSEFAKGYVDILDKTRNRQALLEFLSQNSALLETWSFCDVWMNTLAAQENWEKLGSELLKYSQKKVISTEQMRGYVDRWRSTLSQYQHWQLLLNKAGYAPNLLPHQE